MTLLLFLRNGKVAGGTKPPLEFVNSQDTAPLHEGELAELRLLDAAAVGARAINSRFRNDSTDGSLGPTAIARLNRMCAALDAGTSYTTETFSNDKDTGHLGPHVISLLNQLEARVAAARP